MLLDLWSKFVNFESTRVRPRRVHSQQRNKRPAVGHLFVEPLEDRSLPSALSPTSLTDLSSAMPQNFSSLRLDSPAIRTGPGSTLGVVAFLELPFFDPDNPPTPLPGKDLQTLQDIHSYLESIVQDPFVSVNLVATLRSKVRGFLQEPGNKSLAEEYKQFGSLPVDVGEVLPILKLVDPKFSQQQDIQIPFSFFIGLVNIADNILETGKLVDLDFTIGTASASAKITFTADGSELRVPPDLASKLTLRESGQSVLVVPISSGVFPLNKGSIFDVEFRDSTLPNVPFVPPSSLAVQSSASKDLAQDLFRLVLGVGVQPGSGGSTSKSESSFTIVSGNPALIGALQFFRNELSSGTVFIPVASILGGASGDVLVPSLPGPAPGLLKPPDVKAPVLEPGPAPPVSAETPLNNFRGGFGEWLRRHKPVHEQKSPDVQKSSDLKSDLDSDAPMSSATVPDVFGQWLATLASEMNNSWKFLARIDLDPLQKMVSGLSSALQQETRPPLGESGLDMALSESGREGADALVGGLAAALLAAGLYAEPSSVKRYFMNPCHTHL